MAANSHSPTSDMMLAGARVGAAPRTAPSVVCRAQPSGPQALPSRLSRRDSLAALIAGIAIATPAAPSLAAAGSPGDWSTPGLAAPEDDAAPKFFKTASGVGVQQLSEGNGAEAKRGDKVLVDYVVRRSNGYFIYGTIEGVSFQPRDVPTGPVAIALDDAVTIPGLVEALEGMRAGGKRRILVPPALGYVDGSKEPRMPTFATQRQLDNHRSEPLLFELEMLRVIPGQ